MAKKVESENKEGKGKNKKNQAAENKNPQPNTLFFEDPVDTDLYTFSRESLWKRPNQGPLVTPTYNIAKASGQKELYLGDDWKEYFRSTNSEVAFGRIIARDWGPTKGINDKGKMIFNTLVYPGRNIVRILEVVTGKDDTRWGLVDTLSETTIPDAGINYIDTPQYVHTVYGSGKNETWLVLDKDAPVVPILGSGGRWIQMEWLEKIVLPREVSITIQTGIPVCAIPGDLSSKTADDLLQQQTAVVGELRIAKGGIWGRIKTGWIALRYNDISQTDWNL